MQYDQQRSGVDRRENGHCDQHDKNSGDISMIKGSMNTLKWIIGLMVPVGMALIGYFQIQNGNTLDKVSIGMTQIQATLASSATTDAVVKLQIDQLRTDVEALKAVRK